MKNFKFLKTIKTPFESQNNKPLPDFGGLHPDPNLKYQPTFQIPKSPILVPNPIPQT